MRIIGLPVTVLMVVFILLLLAAGLAALAQRQSGKIKRLNTRLRPIDNADKYAEVTRKHADAKLNEAIEEAKDICRDAEAKLNESIEEAYPFRGWDEREIALSLPSP